MSSLRERNRLAAMRLTQRTALDMFRERGFDAVTMIELADEVGMAPSTLYRHFETKEAIVLWDESDPALEAALTRELLTRPPLEALRRAFVEELGAIYDADADFQLARIKYIYATEALYVAAAERDYRDRVELTAALRQVLSDEKPGAAGLIAGAALVALDVAFDRWQADDGRTPLAELIEHEFDDLARISEIR